MGKPRLQLFLVISFFLVAFALLLLTFATTKMTVPGDLSQYSSAFSLASYMPTYYWVALEIFAGLFIFAFVKSLKASSKFTNVTIVVSAFAILVALFGTPFLCELNPRLADSWDHGKTALAIQQTGKLTPSTLQYQSYPGAFLILAMLSLQTGISFTSLLQYLPIVLIMVFFVMFLIFAQNLLGKFHVAVLAVIIYGLTAYNLGFIFSPEIFGWTLLFLFLTLAVKQVNKKNLTTKTSVEHYSLLVLLLIAVTLVHPVTQVALSLILGALFFVGYFFLKSRIVPAILLLSAVVLFISWASYNGQFYFNSILISFSDAFKMVTGSFSSSMVTNVSHQANPTSVNDLILFRRALYVIIGLVGTTGLAYLRRKDKPTFFFLVGLLLAGLVTVPLTVFGILPIERPLRLLWLAIAPLSAIAMYKMKKVGSVLVIFLVLTTPVTFASLYWSEANDMTHDWEENGAIFVAGYYNGSVLSNFKDTMLLKYYGNFSKIYNNFWMVGKAPDIFNTTFIEKQNVQIVFFSQLMAEEQTYQGRNISIDSFQQNRGFNCVYDNGHSITIINATWRQFG